ncbi:MAG: MoaD family protein [Deltaproteobacteria bacterium]|nr:MoaD family protein [Deltaproteobacteria bacterium]
MGATLFIPAALRGFTDRLSELELPGSTVAELLEALAARYPDIRPHLYGENGALREFINVFVGESNIRDTGGLHTPVKDGDSVSLVPAIAGGRPEPPSFGGRD